MSTLEQTVPQGYKQTEVGVIPEDWEAKSVGDVTAWLSGGTPSRKREDYWQGNIPWISGSTLKSLELSTSDQSLTKEGVEAGSKMAPFNSTLLLVRGSALHNEIRAGLVVAPLCFNQDVKALIPNSNIVPRYLTIYLLAMESELLKLVSSAGNSAGVLDTELVKNFKFLNPPQEEQAAIANALSDVDALLTELEKLIAKKQAIKTATMQQLLTGKTRLPQFATYTEEEWQARHKHSSGTNVNVGACDDGSKSGGMDSRRKGTKPSELGEIPEDWDVFTFGMLAQPSNKRVNPQIMGGGDFCIELEHVEQNKGCLRGSTITSESSAIKTVFGKQDVLFGKLRSYLRKYWLADRDGVCSTEIWVLKPQNNLVISPFLYQLVQMDSFIAATSEAYGTHMPRADWNVVKNHFIRVPRIEEQTAIATILSDMDNEIQTLEQRLAKTRQIKQGMMQELLTGRTRLPWNKSMEM
ncbi:restriction endonuclease subunit S [Agaribacter flavus]|uniref:Restriction endonuclease subunit S n=1 Tax=Agaribacter flavus TaxID=1902781 RepID=A0ABV7FR21_9ALTE